MPDFDNIYGPTPQLEYRPTRHYGRKTVAQLKTEIQAKDATTYTDKEVNDMTYNDVVFAIRVTPEPEEE
jgi:hypothetical protein